MSPYLNSRCRNSLMRFLGHIWGGVIMKVYENEVWKYFLSDEEPDYC